MPFVSYSNIRAVLSAGDELSTNTGNYIPLYATEVSASNTTQLQRIKRIGGEMDYYIQTGPKSSSIGISAIPITGVGFNQFVSFLALTGDFTSGSFFQVPAYRFDKCFLKSFSFSLEPWKPLIVSMNFDSYGLATGSGINVIAPQTGAANFVSPLRNMSVTISGASFSRSINEYESLSFDIQVDRRPNTELGDAYPKKVSVARISKSLRVNGASNLEWVSDFEANDPVTVTLTMADGNSFSVAGILDSQSVNIDSNGTAKGGLQVIEEMV